MRVTFCERSLSRLASSSLVGSGKVRTRHPISRWDGVSRSSTLSDDKYVKGLEFRIGSYGFGEKKEPGTIPTILMVKALMPYLVGLFGIYCFGPKRPRKPTTVSSTLRLCVGCQLYLKFFIKVSSSTFTLWIRRGASPEGTWLTWKIQKRSSNLFLEKTLPKKGIELVHAVLQ